MNILFLSRWFPYPPDNGSKIRIFNLLRILASKHEVTLISFIDPHDSCRDETSHLSFCQSIHTIPYKDFSPKSIGAVLGFFGTTPRSVVDTYSVEMKQIIEQILDSREVEMVIASQLDMAIYADCFRGLPALFEEAEVGVLYEQFTKAKPIWRRFRYGLTWAKYRRYLAKLLKEYRVCTVVSNKEYNLLTTTVPDYQAFKILPNFVDLNSYRGIRQSPIPKTMLFTGSFTYSPNYEGMQWFLNHVFPHILAEFPDASVTITGDHGNLPLPMTENVTLTGFVKDIREFVARSWVCVVPLHTGGGTRLKVLEALAIGTPVVATSKGVEGIDVTDGEHLRIEDDPLSFAKAIMQVFVDPDLRQRLASNGHKLIQDRYDFEIITPALLSLVDQIADR